MPLVSVIIPTYNRSRLLGRAIASVLNQTFQDFEIVVVDDASSDDTLDVLNELSLQDSRIKVIKLDTNQGAQRARNEGIKACVGMYVAFLDSDDEWLPDKLTKQLTIFKRDNRVGVVYGAFYWKNSGHDELKKQKPRFKGNIYRDALIHWIADTNTLMVKKDVLFQSGLWDERVRSFQEWDICIRLARQTLFDYVPEPLAVYHRHDGPTISSNVLLSAQGFWDVVCYHEEEIIRVHSPKMLSTRLTESGRMFMNAGDIPAARVAFKKALRINPKEFKVIFHLSATYGGLGVYNYSRNLKKMFDKWYKYLLVSV